MAAAHPHEPYPAFDLACIREIIAIVRGGEVRTRLAVLAKCVYDLVGAALAATVGEPDDVEPLIGAPRVDFAALEEAKSALAEAEAQLHTFGADADEAAIDPAVLAILIELAVQLITRWLEKRTN